MTENLEPVNPTEAEIAAANAEAAKQYQMALEASANMIKKDMLANLVQIMNQDPTRAAADCQKAIADFLQQFTIPNARYLLTVELSSALGERIVITPEIQFKLEIVDDMPQAAN